MTTNKSWQFEETCPSCDETNTYHFSEVDEYGFITCKFCGCRMHACSLCDNHDNCNDCDEHDTNKSRWRSDEMTEYMHYRLKLSAEKQVVFSQYLNMQSGIIKALYDDEVDTEAFKSLICKQLSLDPEKKAEPEFAENKLYVDKVGNTWFRHRGHDFHIYRLAHAGHDDDGYLQFTDRMVLCIEEMSGFHVVPDAWCKNFAVRTSNAWSHVAEHLLPAADEYINKMNKEIH